MAMSKGSHHILSDVNLGRIVFSENGRDLQIDFINTEDGAFAAKLTVTGVIALNYHNVFTGQEDMLPAYVGEVTCAELNSDELSSVMQKRGYGFLARSITNYNPHSPFLHIHAEGGELSVDIVCKHYSVHT